MSILSMSITGGVMILVVVLIRALLLERLPKKTFLVLWGLVMLRLLVPFQVSSKGSIYNLLPSNNQVLTPMIPAINTTAPILDIPPIPLTINSTVNNISPITIVWVAGILLILLCTTFVYMRSMRNMKTSLPCENTYVENWLKSISLKRKIQVRVLDRIKTPLTYGLIHPVILLPKNMDYSNEHQLLAILTHEYIHIQRFDNIKKLLMVLTLSIHWFNPLVWVMFVLCNRDIELACDEKVLLDLGHDIRATYALTLVELSEQGNVFSLTSGFSKNALEERVKAIMKHKKMTAFTVAIVIVLIVGVTTVFATSPLKNNSLDNLSTNNIETATDENVVMSYIDKETGLEKISVDGGETWLTEIEYERLHPTPVVEWYTYEEYKEYIEDEKISLKEIIGERGWNPTEGWYTWTKERVDKQIASYEDTLEDIKKGVMHSKTVNGTDEIAMVYDPKDMEVMTEYD